MSWDKNTQTNSKIDSQIEMLKKFNTEYKLEVMGCVKALGSNDEHNGIKEYDIRKLSYRFGDQKFFVLEQMQRSIDCDFDDIIISQKFQDEVPDIWKLEIYIDEDDNKKISDEEIKKYHKEFIKKIKEYFPGRKKKRVIR